MVMPYVSGVLKKLRRIFNKQHISVFFKPSNTLREKLFHPKAHTPKHKKSNPVNAVQWSEKYADLYINHLTNTWLNTGPCYWIEISRSPWQSWGGLVCNISLLHDSQPQHIFSISSPSPCGENWASSWVALLCSGARSAHPWCKQWDHAAIKIPRCNCRQCKNSRKTGAKSRSLHSYCTDKLKK